MRIAIYIRVSTEDQAKEGYSLEPSVLERLPEDAGQKKFNLVLVYNFGLDMSEKYFIRSFGCQMNDADSEVIGRLLERTDNWRKPRRTIIKKGE